MPFIAHLPVPDWLASPFSLPLNKGYVVLCSPVLCHPVLCRLSSNRVYRDLYRQQRASDSRRVSVRFRAVGADPRGNHHHRERIIGSGKRLATTKMRLDFRWMYPIHRDGRKPHQRRVEDV